MPVERDAESTRGAIGMRRFRASASRLGGYGARRMFREHYERELNQLWSRLALVAERFPRVAPELARGAHPSMTRLVQASAFFLAVVRSRLDDDMPELVTPLVDQASPGALRGMPSATIVEFQRRGDEATDLVEPGVNVVSSAGTAAHRRVTFVTRWAAHLPPCTLTEARAVRLSGDQTVVELTMTLDETALKSASDRLRLHIDLGDPGCSADLVYDLLQSTKPVTVLALGADGATTRMPKLAKGSLRRPVWTEPELVPARPEAFPSSALLRYWYCFPALFGFVDLLLEPTFWSTLPRGTARVRFEIELPRGAPAPEGLSTRTVRLGCAPAVNAYDASTRPIVLADRPERIALALPGIGTEHPWILEVKHVHGVPRAGTKAPADVPNWEDGDSSLPLRDDLVLYRLLRSSPPVGDEPLIELSFVGMQNYVVAPPYASITVDTLAYDGRRAGGRLPGELAVDGGAFHARNVTTTTRALPPLFDREIPWRINGYARAHIDRFCEPTAISAFLALHDVPRHALERRAGSMALRHPGVREVVQRSAKRLDHGALQHGDDITIAIDLALFGGRGAAAVLGEILSRALTERTSMLRFVRLRLVGENFLFESGDRPGERLPAPFG